MTELSFTPAKHNQAHKTSSQLLPTTTTVDYHLRYYRYATTTTMAFSTKKVQQRTRRHRQRQVAAASAAHRSFTAAHPSILRSTRHDRNNIRNVSFSATCTAKVYGKRSFPRTVASFEETEERMLSHVEEVVTQPEEEEEEEGVQFGHEPFARRTRKRASRRREVAMLSCDLGAYWYWSVAAATPRVRRAPRCVSSLHSNFIC